MHIERSLGHKTNLNKYNSIEMISSVFSDLNSMKLEINHRKKNDYMETNNMLLKSQ